MASNRALLLLILTTILTLSSAFLHVLATGIDIDVKKGNHVIIESELKNPSEESQDLVYIVQIEHAVGYVVFISIQKDTLAGKQQHSVGISWNPENDGIYEVKTFVISSLESPVLLTDLVQQTRISIDGHTITLCSGSAKCFVDTVTKIIDGDTLDVGNIRIRLALVDTPETNEAGYDEARDFTSTLCPIGSRVLVDQDDGQLVDSFGRMIAKVTCGDKILNAELLDNDHAGILTEYCTESEFSNEHWVQNYGCQDETQEQIHPPTIDETNCDPSYPTVCIPPPPPDLDCGEITYRNFKVLQPDPHRFDGDKDGIGCET